MIRLVIAGIIAVVSLILYLPSQDTLYAVMATTSVGYALGTGDGVNLAKKDKKPPTDDEL